MRRLALVVPLVCAATVLAPVGTSPAQAAACQPGGGHREGAGRAENTVTIKASSSSVKVGTRWTLTSRSSTKPTKVEFKIQTARGFSTIYTVNNPAGKATTINLTAPSSPGKSCYSALVKLPNGTSDRSGGTTVSFVR